MSEKKVCMGASVCEKKEKERERKWMRVYRRVFYSHISLFHSIVDMHPIIKSPLRGRRACFTRLTFSIVARLERTCSTTRALFCDKLTPKSLLLIRNSTFASFYNAASNLLNESASFISVSDNNENYSGALICKNPLIETYF